MEFIAQNYLWFLIGGIIILMAIIGYIAEKTNFGRGNGPKISKVKKEKNIETPELVKSGLITDIPDDVVNEPNEIFENINIVENNVFDDKSLPEEELQPLETFEEDINLKTESVDENSIIAEDLSAPLTDVVEGEPNISDDLNAPFGEEKNIEIQNLQEISDDLNAPFGDLESNVEEVTLDENSENSDAVGTIENNEEIEEDEVWKF